MIFDPCRMDVAHERAESCSQLRRHGDDVTGEYFIHLYNTFQVMCDMKTDGGGWTVIQRRGKKERIKDNLFEKTDKEYKEGFGEAARSYWLGNENIHRLTSFPNGRHILKIVLTLTEEGENITVEYDNFKMGSHEEKYKLTIGKYKGPDGYDALTSHKEGEFMIGKDEFRAPSNKCHTLRSGGWWYSDCFLSNLNGRKFKVNDQENKMDLGIYWSNARDENFYNVNYHKVEMMIREADFKLCMGIMAN